MSNPTKSCNLAEDEVRALILHHSSSTIYSDIDTAVERINYLNKRLKTFNEAETVKPVTAEAPSEKVGW